MTAKQIETTIQNAVREAMKAANERYVTAEELCRHIGTLTPRFLQDHGTMFNRKQLEWEDKQGRKHKQGWLYPLNEIKQQFLEGNFKEHS